MPSSSNGVPYVAEGRDRFIVGYVFSQKSPGRAPASSEGAAVQTADGRLFLFVSGYENHKANIAKYDIAQSKMEGRWSGVKGYRAANCFPIPGEEWAGSEVVRVQSVEKTVNSLIAASEWGAKHIFKESTPFLIASNELDQIRRVYGKTLFDTKTGRLIEDDAVPNPEALPKAKAKEAVSKWVIDATPELDWQNTGETYGSRLAAALWPHQNRARVVDALAASIDDVNESGTLQAKMMADAVMHTFRAIVIEGGDKAFMPILKAFNEVSARAEQGRGF